MGNRKTYCIGWPTSSRSIASPTKLIWFERPSPARMPVAWVLAVLPLSERSSGIVVEVSPATSRRNTSYSRFEGFAWGGLPLVASPPGSCGWRELDSDELPRCGRRLRGAGGLLTRHRFRCGQSGALAPRLTSRLRKSLTSRRAPLEA